MLYRSSLLGSLIPDGDEADDFEFLDDSDRANIAKLFTEKLERVRPKELERGITLVGPHRDDLVLMLGTLPVQKLQTG